MAQRDKLIDELLNRDKQFRSEVKHSYPHTLAGVSPNKIKQKKIKPIPFNYSLGVMI